MCCIFTYLSWTIDYIQRLWTFLMSCCIGCTVCVLLLVAALAGIAFGYNYSVSEYVRIEGSNKYVVVSRNIFPNKTTDKNIQRIDAKEYVTNHNDTYFPEDSNLRKLNENDIPHSGAFESEDQNKNVNSLSSTDTWDLEMDEIINKYPRGSVDQMKAILNHINSRKSRKNFNKTTRIYAMMRPVTGTTRITFVTHNVTEFITLQENNQTSQNSSWTTGYLTLTDIPQKQSQNSTPYVEI